MNESRTEGAVLCWGRQSRQHWGGSLARSVDRALVQGVTVRSGLAGSRLTTWCPDQVRCTLHPLKRWEQTPKILQVRSKQLLPKLLCLERSCAAACPLFQGWQGRCCHLSCVSDQWHERAVQAAFSATFECRDDDTHASRWLDICLTCWRLPAAGTQYIKIKSLNTLRLLSGALT